MVLTHSLGGSRVDTSQKRTDLSASDFKRFVEDTMKKWKVPGLSLAVVDGDETHAEGFGFATLPDVAATPETLFHAASTTKAFTASSVALLLRSGHYPALSRGWATPISSILKGDFVLQDAWATEHLTLEDAVSHRTGLPRHEESWTKTRNGRPVTIHDRVHGMRYLPPSCEPRVKFQYNNFMYVALASTVETLTGTSFSNVLDFAKWVRCLIDETQPFTKQVHDDIKKPRIVVGDNPYGKGPNLYSLGFFQVQVHGMLVYFHSGGIPGFSAQVYWVPEIRYGIVAFANAGVSGNMAQDVIIWKLLEEKMGVPPEKQLNLHERYLKDDQSARHELSHARETWFPEHPPQGIPQTGDLDTLAGTYEHPAYATLNIKVDPREDGVSATHLTAARTRKSSGNIAEWRFRHVSESRWLIELWDIVGNFIYDHLAAEFEFKDSGDNNYGTSIALSVKLSPPNAIWTRE